MMQLSYLLLMYGIKDYLLPCPRFSYAVVCFPCYKSLLKPFPFTAGFLIHIPSIVLPFFIPLSAVLLDNLLKPSCLLLRVSLALAYVCYPMLLSSVLLKKLSFLRHSLFTAKGILSAVMLDRQTSFPRPSCKQQRSFLVLPLQIPVLHLMPC